MKLTLPVIAVLSLGAAAAAAALWHALETPGEILERVGPLPGKSSGQAMCPWRNPEKDIRAFFRSAGGQASYQTETLALSSIRLPILARLGPGGSLGSNTLYVHRVEQNGRRLGSAVVNRSAGPHGAIEVVLAVDNRGRVLGVRVQRHREPPEAARFLESSAWLSAFSGKTANSTLAPGSDLPSPPGPAADAARTMAAAIRSALIVLDAADHYYGTGVSPHH